MVYHLYLNLLNYMPRANAFKRSETPPMAAQFQFNDRAIVFNFPTIFFMTLDIMKLQIQLNFGSDSGNN